jgi:hypothetical protein
VARTCFYCGAKATEVEHGIPVWVPRLVGLEGREIEHLETRAEPRPAQTRDAPSEQLPYSLPAHPELEGAQPIERLHRAIDETIDGRAELAPSEYAVTSLCAGCAAAVARIDRDARPTLERMIGGDACRLGPEEQRRLAVWAARAAYAVLTVERKSQGVPKSHRTPVRRAEGPHENVFVGIGRYRHRHVGVLAARQHTALAPDGGTVEAYNVLLVFGHLAAKIFGVRRRPDGVRVKPPEGEMVRLWPQESATVSWPPVWSLSELTLEHAFLYEPFFRPYRYSEVAYLGPGKKIKAKRKRTEGLRGRN